MPISRNRAWRRQQRLRHIRRRLSAIRNIFTLPQGQMRTHSDVHDCYGLAPASWRLPGYYNKQKPIDCSCWMCAEQYERHKDHWRFELEEE